LSSDWLQELAVQIKKINNNNIFLIFLKENFTILMI
jgi:hypothetical protein